MSVLKLFQLSNCHFNFFRSLPTAFANSVFSAKVWNVEVRACYPRLHFRSNICKPKKNDFHSVKIAYLQ